MNTITKLDLNNSTFDEILDCYENHRELLSVGLEKEITLKDGTKHIIRIADMQNGLVMDFKNVVCYSPQYGVEKTLKNIYNNLPDELQGKMDLFLPSEKEVFGRNIYANNKNGNQFEIYKQCRNRIKCDKEDEIAWWWLRSPNTDSTNFFCSVDTGGSANYAITNKYSGISPAFRFVAKTQTHDNKLRSKIERFKKKELKKLKRS